MDCGNHSMCIPLFPGLPSCIHLSCTAFGMSKIIIWKGEINTDRMCTFDLLSTQTTTSMGVHTHRVAGSMAKADCVCVEIHRKYTAPSAVSDT